jgi:glycosyltransferase involved in cell wall biosynthesis
VSSLGECVSTTNRFLDPLRLRRVGTDGKFLSLDGAPFHVRGVTYGSFKPRLDGLPFPERSQIKVDFAEIARAGLNVVRTYTVPSPDLLDAADELGLRLIVGLDYADWRSGPSPGREGRRRVLNSGRRAVLEAMERCAGRDAVMAVCVGNEISGDLVRLFGIRAVEDTLSQLVREVHDADPNMLATYANYPSTEYLQIEDQDFACFNVFLEDPTSLGRYLRHLQVVSGDLPLVIGELGLASKLHGEEAQARSIEWQLRIADESGCAGALVFSWTDEWGVAGRPVEGWGFGLTDEERRPKPALDVVRSWAGSTVRDMRPTWPKISVVVCAYNEERTIGQCLRSLQETGYSNLEVIICDDGSRDRTVEVARRYPCTIVKTPHRGLGAARNAGIAASTGEIVAFLDADAYCHPEWPYRLALSLGDERVGATGGPNLPDPDAQLVARAVALSPGAPTHVLFSDDRAEHVPGCNMAFRREALEQVGGFDPAYTSAGDDVDVCWKLLDQEGDIAFAPMAQVRHHRRGTVRGYLRQQLGYGRAERLLSSRHRHRFNRLGQARWTGFIYGGPRLLRSMLRPVVYHGAFGMAPFQAIERRPSERALALFQAAIPLSLPLAVAGAALSPLSNWALVVTAVALLWVLAHATAVAFAVRPYRREPHPLRIRALVAALHVAQPFVRGWGRMRGAPAVPDVPAAAPPWNGDRAAWLFHLRRDLAAQRCTVHLGLPNDRWDIQVSVGPLLSCRITTALAWRWDPVQRVSLRARVLAPVLVGGIGAIAFRSALQGIGAGAVLVCAFALEWSFLRRTVRGALERTTIGARGHKREGAVPV